MKHHQRDRNRAPSEPAGMSIFCNFLDRLLYSLELLEAVRASLRMKVMALAEDNWLYEAEEDPVVR